MCSYSVKSELQLGKPQPGRFVSVPEVKFGRCLLLAPQLVAGYLVWARGEVAQSQVVFFQKKPFPWC